MSIRCRYLEMMKSELFHNFPKIVQIRESIRTYRDKINSLIKESVYNGYTDKELGVINKLNENNINLTVHYKINLGAKFKNYYYNETTTSFEFVDKSIDSLILEDISLFVELPIFHKRLEKINLPDLSSLGILEKIYPINENIVVLVNKLIEFSYNFDRFINKNTNICWLKKEIPYLYEQYKHLRNTPSR